jgi:hypothetical protein
MVMPDREWNLFGLKFNLRPGKFNYKEHVVIVAMSNVSDNLIDLSSEWISELIRHRLLMVVVLFTRRTS